MNKAYDDAKREALERGLKNVETKFREAYSDRASAVMNTLFTFPADSSDRKEATKGNVKR